MHADHDAGEPLAQVLLESVAEKTGYPIDMLELDMRLDTDLGIDSIKRVEILSAVQDRLPAVGSISPEQLGTLATLRQIVEALSATPAPPASPAHAASKRRARRDEKRKRDAPSRGESGTAVRARRITTRFGRQPRAPILSVLHPGVRVLEDGDWSRNDVRLRAGGTVWVTADGSPLTEAICAALADATVGAR